MADKGTDGSDNSTPVADEPPVNTLSIICYLVIGVCLLGNISKNPNDWERTLAIFLPICAIIALALFVFGPKVRTEALFNDLGVKIINKFDGIEVCESIFQKHEIQSMRLNKNSILKPSKLSLETLGGHRIDITLQRRLWGHAAYIESLRARLAGHGYYPSEHRNSDQNSN